MLQGPRYKPPKMSFIMAELSKGFRELPITIRAGVEIEKSQG